MFLGLLQEPVKGIVVVGGLVLDGARRVGLVGGQAVQVVVGVVLDQLGGARGGAGGSPSPCDLRPDQKATLCLRMMPRN